MVVQIMPLRVCYINLNLNMIPCKSTLLLLLAVLPTFCFLNCAANYSNATGCLSCDAGTTAFSLTFNAS